MRYFKLIISALTMLVVSASMYAMAASIPLMIPYQGTIVVYQSTDDVIGTKPNGDGQFKFAIVSQGCEDAENATLCTSYWSNDGSKTDGSEPTNYISIPVSNGSFAVKLGDISIDNKSGDALISKMQAIPGSVFDNSTTYLRVWFDDGEKGFQQLSPDRQLVSVSYAYRADRAYMADAVIGEGVVSSTQIAAGAVDTPQIKDAAVTSAKIANGTIAVEDISFDPATQSELDTHKTSGDHDGRYFTEAELNTNTPETFNSTGNPVDWTKLKGVPSGFADNIDNEGSGPSSDVVCDKCVHSTDIADGQVTAAKINRTGLDADTLDSKDSTSFAAASHQHSGAEITSGTVVEALIDSALTRDSEVMTTVLANDGTGSNLDADLLDGNHASAFSPSTHDHDGRYFTEAELKDQGTINSEGNPVDWTKLKGVPAGFIDNIDNEGAGDIIAVYAGTGLTGGGTSGDVTIGISPGGVGNDLVSFNYAGGTSKGGPASDLACTTGCVSESELTFSGIKPSNRVVVAKKGGDFQTITEALEKITPSEKEPYVIDVMPGTYFENITMKDYVHLRGAGRDVTIIQSQANDGIVISLNNLNNVTISGFTIKAALGISVGIRNYNSSPTIIGNTITKTSDGIYTESNIDPQAMPTITGNIIRSNTRGISNKNSSPIINGNTIMDNTFFGIINSSYSSPTIRGNNINNNKGDGIYNQDSSPTIVDNTIELNSTSGIKNTSSSLPKIIGNLITKNDIGITNDASLPTITGNIIKKNMQFGIYNISGLSIGSIIQIIHNEIIENTNPPNTPCSIFKDGNTYTQVQVSFNIVDTFCGNKYLGAYNVDQNGMPITTLP